ncbi:MAG: hypothetical protein FVQ77_01670, partial [Cytophagales bacterium]|nr:hypothetical protein [Cytophagales bacterium]
MVKLKNYISYLILLTLTINGVNAQSPDGSISLFIRDQHTGYGLKSRVEVTSESKETIDVLKTKGSGHVTFEAKPGKYYFNINSEGYSPMSAWFQIGSGKNLDVEVFLDKMNYMPSDIKDTIGESKAVVEGYVVDRSTGKPLYGVDFKITNLDLSATSFWQAGKSIKTDQKGYFYVEVPFFSVLEENDEQPVRTDIVFKKSGYKTYVEKNVLILPDKQTMKITLEQGEGQIV